jgi:hypothetical protein
MDSQTPRTHVPLPAARDTVLTTRPQTGRACNHNDCFFVKHEILILLVLTSIGRCDQVSLFSDAAYEHRWYPDSAALSFGLPASRHSSPLTYSFTQLVVLPSAPPLLSESQFAFTIQQYTPALLTVKVSIALAYDESYVYDGEPELSASSDFLLPQFVPGSFQSQ